MPVRAKVGAGNREAVHLAEGRRPRVQRGSDCTPFERIYSTLLRNLGSELKAMQRLLGRSSLRSALDVDTQAPTAAKRAAQVTVMCLFFSSQSISQTQIQI